MPGNMIVMRCPVGYRQTASGTNYGTQMAAVSQSYIDKRELIELVERRSVLPNALPEQLDMKVDQDKPILRVYPYSGGIVVCRTSRVRNRLDDERACLFSCSLVFNTGEADAVLRAPFGLADPQNYDQYALCCERIRNAKDSRLTANDTLGLALLHPETDADVRTGSSILEACGFDRRSLELYVQGLLLCAEDQTRRMVVILPREVREDWHSGDLSEQLICESYLLLLPRHRKNLGFVSHWAGGVSGEHIAGMQVCFFHPSGDGKDLRELKQSGCMILDLEEHSSANLQRATPGFIRLLTDAVLEADGQSRVADFDQRVQELFQAGDKLSARRMEALLTLFTLQDSPQGDGPEREAAVAAVISSFGKNAIQNRSGYREMLHGEIDQLIQRGRLPVGQQLSALQTWMRNGDSSRKQLDNLYRMLLSAVYTGEDQPEAAAELLEMAKEDQGYAQILRDFCQDEHPDLLAAMGKNCCDVQFFSLMKAVSEDRSGFSEELREMARSFMDISIVTAIENKLWNLIPPWLERAGEFLDRKERNADGSLQTVYEILFQLEHSEANAEIRSKVAELLGEPARAEKLGRLELFYKAFLLHLADLTQEKKAPVATDLDMLLELSCMDVDPVAPLFSAYGCFLRNRKMAGAERLHDFSSTVERLADTRDETRRLRLCESLAKMEMLRFQELPEYVQQKELVIPLLKRFKPSAEFEESRLEPIFDYISTMAQRQVGFHWDKLALDLAQANFLVPFYVYAAERRLPALDTLESRINKTSATRQLLLYSASRREEEAKHTILEIEQRWFSQAVDRIGALGEWIDALHKEQSIAVGCDATVIAYVDASVQTEFINRISRMGDLAEIPPELLQKLSSLGSAVHAEAQLREYVPILELDRYWDGQYVNRMEQLWEENEHSWHRHLLEERMNYRLKNDGGTHSASSVTALLLLSLDRTSNRVNESAFLERLIRLYPDDGDRVLLAFHMLNQPELNTLRNGEQVSQIMNSYLLRVARENRDAFCTSGTTQLSKPLHNELSLMRIRNGTQYQELGKVLSRAGIRLDASRLGDWGLTEPIRGKHRLTGVDIIILILSFIGSVLVSGAVGYCALFLLAERMAVIILFVLVLAALIQQLVTLVVRLLKRN